MAAQNNMVGPEMGYYLAALAIDNGKVANATTWLKNCAQHHWAISVSQSGPGAVGQGRENSLAKRRHQGDSGRRHGHTRGHSLERPLRPDVLPVPPRNKKGHGKPIRRLAMTSILKRNPRVSRPPDQCASGISVRASKALKSVLRGRHSMSYSRRSPNTSTPRFRRPAKK